MSNLPPPPPGIRAAPAAGLEAVRSPCRALLGGDARGGTLPPASSSAWATRDAFTAGGSLGSSDMGMRQVLEMVDSRLGPLSSQLRARLESGGSSNGGGGGGLGLSQSLVAHAPPPPSQYAWQGGSESFSSTWGSAQSLSASGASWHAPRQAASPVRQPPGAGASTLSSSSSSSSSSALMAAAQQLAISEALGAGFPSGGGGGAPLSASGVLHDLLAAAASQQSAWHGAPPPPSTASINSTGFLSLCRVEGAASEAADAAPVVDELQRVLAAAARGMWFECALPPPAQSAPTAAAHTGKVFIQLTPDLTSLRCHFHMSPRGGDAPPPLLSALPLAAIAEVRVVPQPAPAAPTAQRLFINDSAGGAALPELTTSDAAGVADWVAGLAAAHAMTAQ